MDVDGNKRVFHRLGGPSGGAAEAKPKVCNYWRAGKCTRFPCPYLHRELPPPPAASNGTHAKRPADGAAGSAGPGGRRGNWGWNKVVRKTEKVCNFWIQGSCNYGVKCRFLHTWSMGDSFSLLTKLEGHEKVVTGIALPVGSDKLYTGSSDETVRVWDCQSGQCTAVIKLGGEVGCMMSEGPWLFVGIPNAVKAWNTQTTGELTLSGPVGQVYALVVGDDLLFAGTQDGAVLVWKFNPVTNCFEPAASLKGHTLAVVSLLVRGNRLYSGSMDKSIKVWNLETLQCLQTLTEHNNIVMSFLWWEQFLLSCSLDNTIKVWVATESGNLEVAYTHNEESGLLTLCGMHDLETRPVVLCSCNDNSVRCYDLPSFSERGKIFSKQEVRVIHTGPGGLFFTGDGTGEVRVWRWVTEQNTTA